MKKLIRNALAASLALAVSFCMVSCGGDEEETVKQTVQGVEIKPAGNFIGKNDKITLKAKDKGADVYYEVVAKGSTPTLTAANYAEIGTKYKTSIPAQECTVTAVAVLNGVVSEIASNEYSFAIAGADSDIEKIHDMILPSGTGVTIPAWTKSEDAYVTDLDPVVTGFTTSASKYVELSGATNRTDKLIAALDAVNKTDFFDDKEVKNVIFVFADGWGESHIAGSRHYYNDGVLVVDHLPYHAAVNHDSYDKATSDEKSTWTYNAADDSWSFSGAKKPSGFTTTDSTAGGTALNTGFTTYYSACDVDIESREVKSLIELAREKGMLTANVTNDWLTDATPATVGVHSPKRKDSNIINGRMYLTSPDWTMGNGGFTGFLNKGASQFQNISKQEFSTETPVQLEQWFSANMNNGRLKTWAKMMLKEYDGKDVDNYTFDTWTTDRNLKSYTSFASAFSALEGDWTIRPLVSLNKSHNFEYDATTYSAKTGKYTTAPALGYKLGYNSKTGEQAFPNYAEMVASTLYVLDKKAKLQNRGFFAFIENTCPDGWGHATEQYDCINEMQITDEAIAIAVKYVLENPDTLLVISADHETGKVMYDQGWAEDHTKIVSRGGGNHSSQPVPVYAFGAGAKQFWGDVPAVDMSEWTPEDHAAFVQGDVYPAVDTWNVTGYADATKKTSKGTDFPKILRNRTTGIRVAKAMGYDHFGDLNGNGVLDEETEYDSIVSYDKVATNK